MPQQCLCRKCQDAKPELWSQRWVFWLSTIQVCIVVLCEQLNPDNVRRGVCTVATAFIAMGVALVAVCGVTIKTFGDAQTQLAKVRGLGGVSESCDSHLYCRHTY